MKTFRQILAIAFVAALCATHVQVSAGQKAIASDAGNATPEAIKTAVARKIVQNVAKKITSSGAQKAVSQKAKSNNFTRNIIVGSATAATTVVAVIALIYKKYFSNPSVAGFFSPWNWVSKKEATRLAQEKEAARIEAARIAREKEAANNDLSRNFVNCSMDRYVPGTSLDECAAAANACRDAGILDQCLEAERQDDDRKNNIIKEFVNTNPENAHAAVKKCEEAGILEQCIQAEAKDAQNKRDIKRAAKCEKLTCYDKPNIGLRDACRSERCYEPDVQLIWEKKVQDEARRELNALKQKAPVSR